VTARDGTAVATSDPAVEHDRNGLEVLDEGECLELLGRCAFGRIAVTIGAVPMILPVNYRLVAGRVLFRTGVGTKLAAATAGDVVAFEVDAVDPLEHTGWSVVVTGKARRVEDPYRLAAIDETSIPRWAPNGGPTHLVEVEPTIVSGRRLLH
jgi:nitroimidazol reductase NimA-like FMN-containing flavoprotein (pyridoxamine 5'-phosphate oxidase superfamily)